MSFSPPQSQEACINWAQLCLQPPACPCPAHKLYSLDYSTFPNSGPFWCMYVSIYNIRLLFLAWQLPFILQSHLHVKNPGAINRTNHWVSFYSIFYIPLPEEDILVFPDQLKKFLLPGSPRALTAIHACLYSQPRSYQQRHIKQVFPPFNCEPLLAIPKP